MILPAFFLRGLLKVGGLFVVSVGVSSQTCAEVGALFEALSDLRIRYTFTDKIRERKSNFD
jgi:hypothetical protein